MLAVFVLLNAPILKCIMASVIVKFYKNAQIFEVVIMGERHIHGHDDIKPNFPYNKIRQAGWLEHTH
jgi:hypothetical protein